MDSAQLLEYMRTGTIRPIEKGDSKSQVLSKLGPPGAWKGQLPDLAWVGPELLDFRDSSTWFYGSLIVAFPDPSIKRLPGIRLNYNARIWPIRFSHPFTDLPLAQFTTRELIDMLDCHGVQFEDVRPDRTFGIVLVSEGGIAAAALSSSPKAQIIHLGPHELGDA